MNNRAKQCNQICSSLIFVMVLLLPTLSAFAQITDQTIRFSTSRVNLLFQPPLRSGFNSEHPVEIELPQLNMAVNLMENYLQYLHKLQKVATGTTLQIIYAPGQSSESWDENPRLIKLSDPGINQILQKVNQYLADQPLTEKTYLLDNAESLLTIPDNYSRRTCEIAGKLELANISSFIDSLEPDTEIAVATGDLVYSTRPHRASNRIFAFSELNDVCSASIILGPARKWYANLRPSPDSRFLAYTDDFEPMLVKIGEKTGIKLFPERKTLMLSMQWSPKAAVLAGMVLDLNSQERLFFAFDAEKGKMLDFSGIENLGANYMYAPVFWAPGGRRLIMTSGRQINLVDLDSKKIHKSITSLPNEISELVWSDDSQSFALVQIIGQARSKNVFDDYDLRKSILHRFRINADMSVSEDHAQRIESRNTIKLVSFWTMDRILYLEGRLMSKKLNTPFWDLSTSFNAYLTPPPGKSISKEDAAQLKKVEPLMLPMKFLYVFRNLDGKFSNVYDAGYSHTNHVYSDEFNNLWFIGLRKPEEITSETQTFNLRPSPYPFPENNRHIFTDYSAAKVEKFVKFLQDYNLRISRISNDNRRFFFLANFCGPLNIWQGTLPTLVEGLSGGAQN